MFRWPKMVCGHYCWEKKEGRSRQPDEASLRKQGITTLRSKNTVHSMLGRSHRLVVWPAVAFFIYRSSWSMQKRISTVEKPSLKSSSPVCRVSLPFCHLSFITSYQSYFCLWGVSRKITYCIESGVLNLCKGKKCVMAKCIYCLASPLGVSLLLEFWGQQFCICHMAEPPSCLPPAVFTKSIYVKLWCTPAAFRRHDLVQHKESCHIAICILRGVSFQPVRRRKDRNKGALGSLELGHVMA